MGTWRHCIAKWGIGPDTPVAIYDEHSGGNAAARAWWMLRSTGHRRCAVIDGGLQAARGFLSTTEAETEAPCPAPLTRVTTWQYPTVSLADLVVLGRDPTWRIIDVRAPERWRGEHEPLDPVAGRIPGSLNMPWTETLGPEGRFKDARELRRMFADALQGVPPVRVVVHCGSGITACHTLLAMELVGLPGARLYVGSWSEWCRSGQPIARG